MAAEKRSWPPHENSRQSLPHGAAGVYVKNTDKASPALPVRRPLPLVFASVVTDTR